MRSRTLTAVALAIGSAAVYLAVVAAQQPVPPAAPGAQTAAGRGAAQAPGRGAAAPPPVPGGLPVKPATEEDLLNDKGGIPEGFTSIFNGQDLTGWHVS